MHKFFHAYSTLEIVVVVGIILLITGMVVPVSIRQTKLNELSVAAKGFHSHVFIQQQNAFTGKKNISHGVYVDSEGYWLFEGDDYATSTVKDYFEFGKGIRSLSVHKELVFPKSSQKPINGETLVLTFDNRNYVILINDEGVLDSYVQK